MPKRPSFTPKELCWYKEIPKFERTPWWTGKEDQLRDGKRSSNRTKKSHLNVAPIAWELLRRHPHWSSFFKEFPPEDFPKEGQEREQFKKLQLAIRVGREETGTALPAAICTLGWKSWPDLHSGMKRFFEYSLPSFLSSKLVDQTFALRLNEKPLIDTKDYFREMMCPPYSHDPWYTLATGEVQRDVGLFVDTSPTGPAPGLLSIDHLEQLQKQVEPTLRRQNWTILTVGVNPKATNVDEVLGAFRNCLESINWKPAPPPKHKVHLGKLDIIAEFEKNELPDDDLRKRLKALYKGVTFEPFLRALKQRKCST